MRPTTRARGLTRLAGAALIAGGLIVAAAGVASADGPVTANPVGPASLIVQGADLANYPTIVPPAGCSDGAGFVTGLGFDVARGQAGLDAGATDLTNVSTLSQLGPVGQLYPGDKVTAHWDGFGGENCVDGESIGVSLALKQSSQSTFDPSDVQLLLQDFAYCGTPGEASEAADTNADQELQAAVTTTSCADAHSTGLSLVMPGDNAACFYQIDLVIGGPLSIVGPGGSFYNNAFRGGNGPNMLIDANNGGNPCEETTTTTSSTTSTVPVTNPNCIDCTTTTTVVNTTQETSTTLATTTTATTIATTTTGATTTATVNRDVTPPPDETVEGTTVTNPDTLPVTGSSTWPAARIGMLMVLSGAAALVLSKRRRAEA